MMAQAAWELKRSRRRLQTGPRAPEGVRGRDWGHPVGLGEPGVREGAGAEGVHLPLLHGARVLLLQRYDLCANRAGVLGM